MSFFKYIFYYKWQIITLFIGLSIQVWSALELPDLMSQIVNRGIVWDDSNFILTKSVWMILIALVGGLWMLVSGFFASRIWADLAKTLRKDIYQKTMSFSANELNKFSTSSLITRSTNDITQIQTVSVMVLRMSLQAPLMWIGSVVKALNLAPEMSWIIMLAVALLFVVVATMFFVAIPKFDILQRLIDKLNLIARENLTGLRVVRAFNNEKLEEEKFDDVNTELTKLNMFLNKMMWLLFPFVQLLMNFTTLLVIWVWAKYIESGVVEVWNMMAFLQYAMQVMMSFMFLTMLFIMIPRWAVSWKRISEVLNTKLSIKEWKEKIKNGVQSEIEFKNVSFSYWETSDLVLENISFVAKSGETTAIIGSTGSWKSTIVNLILRFYDATLGQVLVNGMDVRDYKKEDLMKKIWIVPQKSVLFSGSVKDNINFWTNNLSENEIKEFSKIAQASEFIEKLNWKYDFQIAQWWSNLSWWQKQRLSIARAIAKKSEIYIFDDSFSALDFKTDLALRQALKAITKNAVVLIVAQRIWTIKNADQIIVLDKGKIIWIWKHKELLKNCPIYKEIANSQLSEEELTVNNY